MQSSETRRFERYRAGDGSLLAYARGSAAAPRPALLLVHGWQGTSAVWEPLIACLGPRFHTLSVDLRGMGASRDATGPYTVEQFAADLGDLADRLALGPLVVVGHSMGGAVAQRFAIDRPDATLALALVASVPAQALPFPAELDAFFRATVADPAERLRWLRGLTTAPQPPETTALLLAAAASVRREVALESYASWTGLDFVEELRRIERPVLVVAPSGDRPMTPALARERVASPIAGSRFEELSGCRHYAQLDCPEALAGLLLDFAGSL
jgi:pimeloyl-ACP methyl ester carboxylesterase